MGSKVGAARPGHLIAGQMPAGEVDAGFIGMVTVLVLHRCELHASQTWLSLVPQVEQLAVSLGGRCGFHLLLCENEALAANTAQPGVAGLPDWAEHRANAENAGLSWAYNAGLRHAQETGAAWLLTLDQDMRLPADFLEQSFAHALGLAGRAEIAAIVPQLVGSRGRAYSPVIAKLGYEQTVPLGFTGVAKGDVRAFNAGALMRVSWLASIGGYSSLFWLDYLDHATFRALGRAGGKLWIAGELQVEHHLSIEEGRATMSEARFANFLRAEAGFRDLYGSRLEGWLYTLRLMFRLWNQRRRGDPAYFIQQTRELLRDRMKLSRRRRLALWRESSERR